ncbi:hypothetical protein SAY87_019991 [Trapa incisa]|uniref:Uncharacterized protein n=1 Tax=Trapa incisa TaxID=236973 RepID=A0AAN7Q850_9MYRT|nr:hypothetical protein SAY87_019991 [Trapa incisa]
MDKASILGHTIRYVKQLLKKIQDLEAKNQQTEADQKSNSGVTAAARPSPDTSDKRKTRLVEGTGGVKSKAVVLAATAIGDQCAGFDHRE